MTFSLYQLYQLLHDRQFQLFHPLLSRLKLLLMHQYMLNKHPHHLHCEVLYLEGLMVLEIDLRWIHNYVNLLFTYVCNILCNVRKVKVLSWPDIKIDVIKVENLLEFFAICHWLKNFIVFTFNNQVCSVFICILNISH